MFCCPLLKKLLFNLNIITMLSIQLKKQDLLELNDDVNIVLSDDFIYSNVKLSHRGIVFTGTQDGWNEYKIDETHKVTLLTKSDLPDIS